MLTTRNRDFSHHHQGAVTVAPLRATATFLTRPASNPEALSLAALSPHERRHLRRPDRRFLPPSPLPAAPQLGPAIATGPLLFAVLCNRDFSVRRWEVFAS